MCIRVYVCVFCVYKWYIDLKCTNITYPNIELIKFIYTILRSIYHTISITSSPPLFSIFVYSYRIVSGNKCHTFQYTIFHYLPFSLMSTKPPCNPNFASGWYKYILCIHIPICKSSMTLNNKCLIWLWIVQRAVVGICRSAGI